MVSSASRAEVHELVGWNCPCGNGMTGSRHGMIRPASRPLPPPGAVRMAALLLGRPKAAPPLSSHPRPTTLCPPHEQRRPDPATTGSRRRNDDRVAQEERPTALLRRVSRRRIPGRADSRMGIGLRGRSRLQPYECQPRRAPLRLNDTVQGGDRSRCQRRALKRARLLGCSRCDRCREVAVPRRGGLWVYGRLLGSAVVVDAAAVGGCDRRFPAARVSKAMPSTANRMLTMITAQGTEVEVEVELRTTTI